mgnify:CR=1 FL=1
MSYRAAGVTLVELLVALVVGALVVLAAVQLYATAARTATTVTEIGRLADRALLLQRLLHDEVGSAGRAPCGARTPLYGPDRATANRVVGALLEPAGVRVNGGTLQVARHPADPAQAAARYRRPGSGDPEAGGLTLRLSRPARDAFGGRPDEVLAGDCRGLYRLPVRSAHGDELSVAAPSDPDALPSRGVVWAPWWRAAGAEAGAGGGAASGSVAVRRFRATGPEGADGVPTLNRATSLAGPPQPVIRGVAALAMGFAECPGTTDPRAADRYPERFRRAEAVADWDAVCAVRFAAEVRAGGAREGVAVVARPVTVTVPIRGRLP